MRGDDFQWSRIDSVLSRYRGFTPADSTAAAFTVEQEWYSRVPGSSYLPFTVIFPLVNGVAILQVVALLSLMLALVMGVGPTAKMARIDIVARDGTAAGRLRLFSRAFLTWLPVLAIGGIFFAARALRRTGSTVDTHTLIIVFGVVLLLGCVVAALALVTPQRGIADRLSGTFLVPR
jgi:hypothetical protein